MLSHITTRVSNNKTYMKVNKLSRSKHPRIVKGNVAIQHNLGWKKERMLHLYRTPKTKKTF